MRSNDRRPRPPKAEVASPTSRLDPMEWPEVPKENRPRELVFDTLHDDDVQMLERRGYKPILLRTLPRRTEQEQQEWRLRIMQGVAEGTVQLDKSRSEGLFYDLKSHGHLDKRQFSGEVKPQVDPADLRAALNWGSSRHSFAGNTTMVRPEDVMEFMREVGEHAAQKRQAELKLVPAIAPIEDEEN